MISLDKGAAAAGERAADDIQIHFTDEELAELVRRYPIDPRPELPAPLGSAYAWTGALGVAVSLGLAVYMLARVAFA